MRQYKLTEVIESILLEFQANLHTALAAKVTKVNETTINCQPVIAKNVDGVKVPLTEFANVPPVFMQGGESYQTFPIAEGDYCLLIVSERCLDGWYNGQDNQLPVEYRMHDYSDCFAIVGVNPKRKALTIPNKITTKGDQAIIGNVTQTGNLEIDGNLTVDGDITQTGTLSVTGDIEITGKLSVTGTITINGLPGYTGAFATADSRTATVTSGLITSIT